MRSLRLDPDLEARLQEAAAVRGESLSEFIRQAVAERAETTLAVRAGLFDDVLGVVHAGGGRARRTGVGEGHVLDERSATTSVNAAPVRSSPSSMPTSPITRCAGRSWGT